MKPLNAVAFLAVAGVLAGAGFIYSGLYDVSADRPHWPVTAALMEILREKSISARSEDIDVPALDDPGLIAEGAEHYPAMCSGCHLAPGMDDTEIRAGIYPRPPNLAEAGRGGDGEDAGTAAARQFWIIKHGLKLTGMPAWGTTHDDRSIWGLVAFVRRLPELSPAQYKTMTEVRNAHSHADRGHGHSPHAQEPAAAAGGHTHDTGANSDAVQASEDEDHHHGPGDTHGHDHAEKEELHTH
ncbi:MAG: c-type cytochrome [Gammaproteobacteria bacterium]|nr:c-type cytochrome [Gammaproteobacteria bacterium]